MDVIDSFSGENYFLSNFYPSPLTLWGIDFPTGEHAFQAGKSEYRKEMLKIAQAPTPGAAKGMGRRVTLQPYWNECARYEVMKQVLRAKFSDPYLMERLMSTGDAILIEGNTWGDRTWGVSGGEGHNLLGWMLMKIRSEW